MGSDKTVWSTVLDSMKMSVRQQEIKQHR